MHADFANTQVIIAPGTYKYSGVCLTFLANGPLALMRICDALAAARAGSTGFEFILRAGRAGELTRARMAMALARAYLGECEHARASSLLLWQSARYVAAAHARSAIADALVDSLKAAWAACVGLSAAPGALEDVCALDPPLRELAQAAGPAAGHIGFWRSDPRLTTAAADMVTLTVRPHIGPTRHLRMLELAGIGCGENVPQHGGIRAVDGRDFPSGEPGAPHMLPYLQPGAGDLIRNWAANWRSQPDRLEELVLQD